MPIELEQSWSNSAAKSVFINHVDCFLTGYIAKYLSSCIVGITLMEEDIQEEVEEELRTDQAPAIPLSEQSYKIIGTVKDPMSPKPHFVHTLIQNKNPIEMFQVLKDCEVIIYDIATDPGQNAEATVIATKFVENLLKMEKTVKKTFVVISSVLTWGAISSLDPEDPNPVFSDEDFRKRRPHKNYRDLYTTEKLLLQYGRTKKNLNTYVIAPGLVYGAREDIFHYLFKAAWLNEKVIPLIDKGDNILPTIHIEDLSKIIQHLIEKQPPKFKYILAVDQSQNSLKAITKSVNRSMGSGVISTITNEEASTLHELTTLQLDLLTLNLKLSTPSLLDTLRFKWTLPNGMTENMLQLVQEFKSDRNLKPIKILILGPPGTGKTSIAKRLQDSHKLHHINIEDVQMALLNDLEERKKMKKPTLMTSKTTSGADDEEVDEANQSEITEEKDQSEDYDSFLESVEKMLEEPDAKIDDSSLITCLKNILLSKPFQNQGFIIDGFPTNSEQVNLLFGTTDEVKEARASPQEHSKLANILPDLVIKLEADDEFLKARIRDLPAFMVENTNNEEKAFLARLKQYRKTNTVESSIEDYLDELDFNVAQFDVSKDQTGISADVLSQIKFWIGEPRIYGPSKEDLDILKTAALELRQRQEEQQREEEERLLAEEESNKNEKKLLWIKRHQIVQMEEKELSEAQSLPLRHYLFRHVMPTLLNALTDCCKIMPDDPVDYLAEYLLGNNPRVD